MTWPPRCAPPSERRRSRVRTPLFAIPAGITGAVPVQTPPSSHYVKELERGEGTRGRTQYCRVSLLGLFETHFLLYARWRACGFICIPSNQRSGRDSCLVADSVALYVCLHPVPPPPRCRLSLRVTMCHYVSLRVTTCH